MERHFGQKVRILLWTFEILLMTGRDFCDDRSRSLWWYIEILMRQIDILLWTVKIFMTTGWNFYDDRSRFLWQQVEISLWTVKILMIAGLDVIMDGQDFAYDRSRFYHEWSTLSQWQVEISMMISGWEFRVNSGAQGKHLIIQVLWTTVRQCSHMSLPYPSSE